MSQLTNSSKITTDLLPQKFGTGGRIWTGILVVLCLLGLYGYYRQVTLGSSRYQYARLCIVGHLHFQFRFFCGD